MTGGGARSHAGAMKRALELVTEAMDLLDAHDGGPELTAHLSLVQDRLRRIVGERRKR